MKIDVEEGEVAMLAGGPRVLGLASTIICEVATRNAAAVRDLLTGHGFALYDDELLAGRRVGVAHHRPTPRPSADPGVRPPTW